MTDFWNGLVQYWQNGSTTNPLVNLLVNIIESLVLLAIFLFLGRFVKNSLKKIAGRASRNPNLGALIGNLAYVGIITILVLSILTIFTGAGFQSLLTLLGVISLAISLSLQDILKNVVAGIYLLLEQPFKIGDIIKVKDVEGQVVSIDIRTTNIRTEANCQVVVPNGTVFTEVIINHTAYNCRMVSLRVVVSDGSGVMTTIEQIQSTLKEYAVEGIAPNPSPVIGFENSADKKITLKVEFWSPQLYTRKIGSKVALAIREALPGSDVALLV